MYKYRVMATTHTCTHAQRISSLQWCFQFLLVPILMVHSFILIKLNQKKWNYWQTNWTHAPKARQSSIYIRPLPWILCILFYRSFHFIPFIPHIYGMAAFQTNLQHDKKDAIYFLLFLFTFECHLNSYNVLACMCVYCV